MIKVHITQPRYLPFLGYVAKAKACDIFIVSDIDDYTSGGYNKFGIIKTKSGDIKLSAHLSIQGKKWSDVKFADRMFLVKHHKSLIHNYSNTFYFKHYDRFVKQILEYETDDLTDFCVNQLYVWRTLYGTKCSIFKSSELKPVYENEYGTAQIIEQLQAVKKMTAINDDYEYLSGAGGREYLKENNINQIESAGFKVSFFEQTFDKYSFVHHLYTSGCQL